MEFEVDKQIGRIHYGFGKEYLPNWGIKEALREIYQNFIDYGEYDEEAFEAGLGGIMQVKLTNGWQPDNLEYLRIGNTRKDNPNAIGHHGEGLKMAFLILLREGCTISVITNKYSITPEWYNDQEIGECFCLEYEVHDMFEVPYTLEFTCPTDLYLEFRDNVIKDADVLFTHADGDIVNKPVGSIYSGGLFVAKVDNLSKSYNIKPQYLPLDRDRSMPKAFDVSWHASQINAAYGKWTAKDTSYSDTEYIKHIQEEIKPQFKPRLVGNNIEFTFKDENKVDQVVRNTYVVAALKSDSYFETAIKRLKRFIVKQLGLYELLVEFKQKHVHSTEALQDFEIILSRVKK